jgi:hypothetical protein
LSENNYYEIETADPGQKGNAERAQYAGSVDQSIGDQYMYTQGCFYGTNCNDDGSDSTVSGTPSRGNIVDLDQPGPYPGDGGVPSIPYSYTLETASGVKAARLADTGASYFIPWTDPA